MPNHPHICVVGSTNIDLTFRTVRLPKPGETLAGHGFQLGYGGKGANQAVMAARLGAHVTMIGKVGRDVFGEGALRNYREQGIDTTHVLIDGERPTGVASIVVDDAARNCILVVPGANLGLTPEDVRAAASVIEGAAVLLCQLEVPIETVTEALRIARTAKVTTILNPAPAVLLPDELLGLADLCVPNESEIELLTGGQTATTVQEAAAAAWELLRRGPRTVIVTLGERGALIADATSAEHVEAPHVEAVDSSGAGDAFIGALGVFLAEGMQLREAVRQANAVAALSVTRLGTQASFPTRAEV
ncbi:MAG TPA: ribokinase [Gemmataceae bacterium]|nr:ribokinase [Gemmataceae bacterium]